MRSDEVNAGDCNSKCNPNVEDNINDDNLDVQKNQATPSSVAEGSPNIGHGCIATAADDGGLDTTLEGGIKGNDGILIRGEERGLDADEDNEGRDDDEDGGHDCDGEDQNELADERGHVVGVKARAVFSGPGELYANGGSQQGRQK